MDISMRKVAQVILMAREMERARGELTAFLDGLNEDEQAELVALFWVGRGSFDADDYAEAVAMARQEATTPTTGYLLGSPHLADHLEAGCEEMGLDVMAEEDDLL